jgi:hypothetical protein
MKATESFLCARCDNAIPSTSISNYCIECQVREASLMGNPMNFGKRWRWISRRYAPIQMVYGTLQSDYIELTAKRAWERFASATGRTKDELMAQGYRVKAIRIEPDFVKLNN